ncbi:exopolysaccharide biosynthesis protein [Rhizobium sp. AC44/96]|jgi:exopolysaccharide production protein ExoZ|uniref:acyltransferase family protein n=1 Tax=Rhizobium sp. AC44/96 TaxID=1841654 RepID=UPI00080FEF36|nr:acyltransferase [Rhizobium sp. AC44/96]OCJ15107.1 exopolysaccharide biosynthesis protein [Rhizobium sp. AC44/96]
MKTLYGIQYLRAFAALAVVVFHAAEKVGEHFAIGAAGVDVFFVISGFIMWVISDRRPMSPQQFLFDRVRRIAPSYWLVTAVMIVGAVVGLFPNLKLTASHIIASLFFVPMRSPSNGEIWPVLVQGWTLNFEIFFYVLFAGALFLPRNWRLGFLSLAFGGFFAFGLIFQPTSPALHTYTRPIILEFLGGVFLAELWLRRWIAGTSLGLACVGASLSGFAAIFLIGADFDEAICGPLAMALVYGMVSLEADGSIGRVPLLTYLGDASYSIYLWHTLAISVIVKIAGFAGLSSAPTVVASVIGGTILGTAAYEFVEKPFRKMFSRTGSKQGALARRPS